jgi:hypothetical protein
MAPLLSTLFSNHPNSVGETYLSHLITASSFSFKMIFGGLACLLHAIFPFLFIKTSSGLISQLHDSMVKHRSKKAVIEKN